MGNNDTGFATVGAGAATGAAVGYGTNRVLANLTNSQGTDRRAEKMFKKEFLETEAEIKKINPGVRKIFTERSEIGRKIKKRVGDKMTMDRRGVLFLPDSLKVGKYSIGDLTQKTKRIQEKKDLLGALGRHKGKVGLAVGAASGLGVGYLAFKGLN